MRKSLVLAPVFALSALFLGAGCSQDPSPADGVDGGGNGSHDMASNHGGGSGGTGGGGSAGTGGGGGGDSTDMASVGAGDMAVVCDPKKSTSGLSDPSGRHNAGMDCLGSRCHASTGQATLFTFAGTLYSTVSGGSAVSGATINVTDAAGKTSKIVTATNGNFWTTGSLTFPIKVNSSLCPNTVPMNGAVDSNGGGCNQSGCHVSTFRVHLP